MQSINSYLSPIYLCDINQLIGHGNFGNVYRCKNMKNENQQLVMKRIKLNIINVRLPEIFLYQEINIMKMLNCEHSVKFYESGKTQNYYNIVMEYCNGKSLDNLIKEKKIFSVSEIKMILNQLNVVFKIMNNKHIIHRDLKPENIFINYPTPNNKNVYDVKLGDYGFSKQLNNSLQTVSPVGSPIYASPEILKNILSDEKIPYNSKSDLWSLGVIIYQLYFGDFPFIPNDNSLKSLYQNIITQKKPPKKIKDDKKLQDLLDKIFEVDAKKRISWNDYFLHEFFDDNNKEIYKDIKEFDLGDNLKNNEFFSCFTAINKRRNEKVLVKKYNCLFCKNNSILFKQSIQRSLELKNNKFSLKFNNFYKKGDYWFFEYDFVEGELLSNYIKKHSFNEKDLLTIDSIFIDKKGYLKLFDFGFLKCILPENIQKEYFISSPLELTNPQINTNVLNFGIILYKIFFKQNLKFTNEKEIYLPDKPKISNEFLNFLSHCLYRKNNLRYKWKDFRDDYWLNPEQIKKNVLKNQNLRQILNYFENKFKIIYEYFSNNENFLMEFLFEKYLFMIFILFEFNMIIKLFDVNKNKFNKQEELFFVEIKNKDNIKYEFASIDLNNFEFKEIYETEDKEKNKERIDYLKNFKNNLINQKENLENLFKKMLTFKELSEYKNLLNKNGFYFVKNYIECFKNSDYNNLMQDFIKNNKKISQYYCEYIITMQIYLSSKCCKNNNNFKLINNMFETEDLAISVVDNDKKNKFLFFSCIGGMFNYYQSSAKKNKKNIKSIFQKYQYEPFLFAYPNILINNLKY